MGSTTEGEWGRQERTSLSGDASTTLPWACKSSPFYRKKNHALKACFYLSDLTIVS